MALALLCTVTATSWHDALPHHDEGAELTHFASVSETPQDEGRRPDATDPLHMAVHAAVHGIAVSATPIFALAIGYAALAWMEIRQEAVSPSPPRSILRPPRG
jgi:hypothetical protein